MKTPANKYSLYAYLLCFLIIAYVAVIFNPKWKTNGQHGSLGWDAATYYWYLPATFIYKDLKQQKFGDDIIAEYQFSTAFEQSFVHETGNRVITYSAGVAVMELPAFAIAHSIAAPLGYKADGFSMPYQVAIQVWTLIWVFIGLWFFRKLLLYHYSDKATAITLLLLVAGSNYLNYHAVDITLTHSWLFSGYVFLMLATRRFYIRPALNSAIAIGVITGLIILIRPSEIIAVLIPVLWGLESITPKVLKQRLLLLAAQYKYLLAAVFCTIAIGSIQVIYWLYVTGQPLVYSYADKGFSWKSPHFFNYTWSYRSGWLVYTPLLIFVFLAIPAFLRYGKNKVALLSFFLLSYYIVAAWDVWWYGGMGGRAMVQSYAVAFIIMAALVESLLKTRWLKWPVFACMAVFVYVNIWFTYNAHSGQGLYDPTGMTKKYYWAVIGRFSVPEYVVRYKDTDEIFTGTPKDMKLLHKEDFEEDSTAISYNALSGNKSIYFDINREYTSGLPFPYTPGQAEWIRVKAIVNIMDREWEGWKMLQLTLVFKEKGTVIKTRMVRLNHIASLGVSEVYFDVKIPNHSFDALHVFFWNPGSEVPVYVDDIEVWSFNE